MNKFIVSSNNFLLELKSQLLKDNVPYYFLAFVITLYYSRILGFGFSPLDDPVLITSRLDWLRDPANLINALSQNYHINLYRPILIVSFMIDAIIGDGRAVVFHMTNLILHIIATLLLFHLLVITAGKSGKTFALSLLFAIHPIHIHSVAWIPGRNDILLSIFVLSTVITVLEYIKDNKTSILIIHVFSFLLAIFTKESAVFIPVITFFIIWNFHRQKIRVFYLKLLPIYVFILGFWTFCRLTAGGNDISVKMWSSFSPFYDLLNLFIISIGKSISPYFQQIIPYYEDTPLLYLIVFLLMITIIIYNIKHLTRWSAVGILWFVLFTIPGGVWSIFVLQDNIFYEHRMYLPLMGVVIFFQSTSP